MKSALGTTLIYLFGSLSNYTRRRPQRRLNDQNNSSARASRFLVLTHFLDFHCTTTTLNLLIHVLCRTWTYDDEFSFNFLNLNKILKNSTPGKVACIWHIERVQIDDINKFERTQTFFYRRFHCRGRRPCSRSVLPSCMTSSSRTTEGEKTSTFGLACDYALISVMST